MPSETHSNAFADHLVEEDRECTDEIVLSIDAKERCIGCCYYSSQNETIFFMEDMKIGGIDIIDTCNEALFHLKNQPIRFGS